MSEMSSSTADSVFSASSRAKQVQYCPHCTLPPDFCRYGPVYNECKSWLSEHYPQYLKPEDAAAASTDSKDSVSDSVAKLKVSDDDSAGGKKKGSKKTKKKQTLAEKQAAAGGGDAWSDEEDREQAEAEAEDDDAEEVCDDDESDGSDDSDKPKRRIKQTSALEAAASKSTGKTTKKTTEKILISRVSRSKNKYITSIRGLDSYGLVLKDVAKAMSKKFACSASVVKVVPSGQEIAIQGDLQQDAPEFLVEKFGSQIPEDQIYIVAEGGKKTRAFD